MSCECRDCYCGPECSCGPECKCSKTCGDLCPETINLVDIMNRSKYRPPQGKLTAMTADGQIYFPLYNNRDEAYTAALAPREGGEGDGRGIHLMVQGLMPAFKTWTVLNEDEQEVSPHKLYYMPNKAPGHSHGNTAGSASPKALFMRNGSMWKIGGTQGTQVKKHLPRWKPGDTWIETYVEWKIPPKGQFYPFLCVPQNSLIWWMFNKDHNIALFTKEWTASPCELVKSKDYQMLEPQPETETAVVTKFTEVGVYGFVCTVKGHCEKHHFMFVCVQ